MRVVLAAVLSLMLLPAAAQEMPPAFKKCLACHAVGEGAPNKVGPQLNGVVGLPAAGVGDYSYSRSMQDARDDGLVWDRDSLTRYLKRPAHFMPGTSMTFYGMTDRAEIDAIIDYLEGFDVDGIRVAP